jgi:hypothetical protein
MSTGKFELFCLENPLLGKSQLTPSYLVLSLGYEEIIQDHIDAKEPS